MHLDLWLYYTQINKSKTHYIQISGQLKKLLSQLNQAKQSSHKAGWIRLSSEQTQYKDYILFLAMAIPLPELQLYKTAWSCLAACLRSHKGEISLWNVTPEMC